MGDIKSIAHLLFARNSIFCITRCGDRSVKGSGAQSRQPENEGFGVRLSDPNLRGAESHVKKIMARSEAAPYWRRVTAGWDRGCECHIIMHFRHSRFLSSLNITRAFNPRSTNLRQLLKLVFRHPACHDQL